MFFYNLIIAPIEMIVGWVFYFFMNKFHGFGVIGAVFGVSIVINFLALPLYNIADSIQERERLISKGLEFRIKRIKKAFKGDEQFMMLSTFYRQNNYHPLYALRSSLSILIEIPFFIAAYKFLSHCDALMGASWFVLKDLGKPDGLLSIAGFKVNVLPVIMTLINIVSGMIYTKGFSVREKLQLNTVAIIFLVLLYSSPSGLVFYWILNNIFSLCKNVVRRQKQPAKIMCIIIVALLSVGFAYICYFSSNIVKKIILIFVYLIVFFGYKFFKNNYNRKWIVPKINPDVRDFILLLTSGIGLALLAGFYLPANVISSSPEEFAIGPNKNGVIMLVLYSFYTFLGLFLFWPIIIYKMFGNNVKVLISRIVFLLFIISLSDVFLFKFNYGALGVTFTFGNLTALTDISLFNKIGPVIFIFVLLIVFFGIYKYSKQSILILFCVSLCFAELALGVYKINIIKSAMKNQTSRVDQKNPGEQPVFHFSQQDKNVLYIFLDRGIGAVFSTMIDLYPEIKASLDGFDFFPNTVSFSSQTTICTPSMLGGYEYSPYELNKRENELLINKQKEAALVLPSLFNNKGYKVTLSDLPFYAKDIDSSSIEFISLKDCYRDAFLTRNEIHVEEKLEKIIRREIKNFSILQILPPICRNVYFKNFKSSNKTEGFYYKVIDSYVSNASGLYFLSELSKCDGKGNQFIFVGNDLTHEPFFCEDDLISPRKETDLIWEKASSMEGAILAHLNSMTVAFSCLKNWFEYLKQNNVYDNTRIIIVADHGFPLDLETFTNFKKPAVPSTYNPLLLYKDFNASGYLKINNDFMSNADSLYLAKKDLNLSDVNPFTGKKLIENKTNGMNVSFLPLSQCNSSYSELNSKFTIDKENGFHINNNIFDENNWIPLKEWEKEGVEDE